MSIDKFDQLKKNTVDSRKQLEDDNYITFKNPDGKGKRIMFMGNSITLHGVNENIGWHGKWGMAASSEDKDYVHLLIKKFCDVDPDSAFCICQVSQWERDYRNGGDFHALYNTARQFCADTIICRFVENCPMDGFKESTFKKEYMSLIDYINSKGNAEIIITTSFWTHPADETIMEVAEERGYPCVLLGDLGSMDEMKAIGKFNHEGVANHPGDLGMKTIAKRIWEEVK